MGCGWLVDPEKLEFWVFSEGEVPAKLLQSNLIATQCLLDNIILDAQLPVPWLMSLSKGRVACGFQ